MIGFPSASGTRRRAEGDAARPASDERFLARSGDTPSGFVRLDGWCQPVVAAACLVSPHAALAYFVLKSFAWRRREQSGPATARPSLKTLARRTLIPSRTLQLALDVIVEFGLVRKRRPALRASNRYELVDDRSEVLHRAIGSALSHSLAVAKRVDRGREGRGFHELVRSVRALLRLASDLASLVAAESAPFVTDGAPGSPEQTPSVSPLPCRCAAGCASAAEPYSDRDRSGSSAESGGALGLPSGARRGSRGGAASCAREAQPGARRGAACCACDAQPAANEADALNQIKEPAPAKQQKQGVPRTMGRVGGARDAHPTHAAAVAAGGYDDGAADRDRSADGVSDEGQRTRFKEIRDVLRRRHIGEPKLTRCAHMLAAKGLRPSVVETEIRRFREDQTGLIVTSVERDLDAWCGDQREWDAACAAALRRAIESERTTLRQFIERSTKADAAPALRRYAEALVRDPRRGSEIRSHVMDIVASSPGVPSSHALLEDMASAAVDDFALHAAMFTVCAILAGHVDVASILPHLRTDAESIADSIRRFEAAQSSAGAPRLPESSDSRSSVLPDEGPATR